MTELSWEMTLHWNFWHFDVLKWKFLAKILRIWWYNFRCGTNENKGRTIWRFFFLSQLLQSTTHTDWTDTYVGLALRQKKSLCSKMGRIYLEHFGGLRLFSCGNCDTFLTNRDELVSTRFTGSTGRAFLFKKVVNLNHRYLLFRNPLNKAAY